MNFTYFFIILGGVASAIILIQSFLMVPTARKLLLRVPAIKKFDDWLSRDRLQEKWDKAGAEVSEVRLTLENGLIRTLSGQAAKEYYKDIYFGLHGRRVDWTRHKWVESRKKD